MKYPETEHPNRRIRELGGQALTNSEILAVAFRITDRETAQALALLQNEYGSLARIPRGKLLEVKGIGEYMADSILAVAEIVRRDVHTQAGEMPAVQSPADAAMLVAYEMAALDHEQFRVILLDTRNRVRRIVTVYKGSVNSAQIRVAEVFKEAIKDQLPGIICVHNHPSGDPTPSPDDVSVTRAIVKAGEMLDIKILDHIVIGQGRWVSLKERGLGF